MDELDRLYRRLVDNIRGTFPELLARGFEVSQLYQQIVPYRTNRRELGFDSNEEYELALMQLLAGLRGYLTTDGELQRAMRTELASPNPDLTAFRMYATSTVALAPEPLRALERRLLTHDARRRDTACAEREPAGLARRASDRSAGRYRRCARRSIVAYGDRSLVRHRAASSSCCHPRPGSTHRTSCTQRLRSADCSRSRFRSRFRFRSRPSSRSHRGSARCPTDSPRSSHDGPARYRSGSHHRRNLPLLQRHPSRWKASHLLPELWSQPHGAALPGVRHGARSRLEVLHHLRTGYRGRRRDADVTCRARAELRALRCCCCSGHASSDRRVEPRGR